MSGVARGGIGVGVGTGAAVGLAVGARVGLGVALGLGLAEGVAVMTAVGVSVGAVISDGSSVGTAVGEALGEGELLGCSVGVASATGPGIALTSRTPASSEMATIIRARATRRRSRRIRPLRGGLRDDTTGRGISGPVGAKGGRGRTVPVMDLATQVRQLRREVLQHSLQTNWRHSWQKRKLWTNA